MSACIYKDADEAPEGPANLIKGIREFSEKNPHQVSSDWRFAEMQVFAERLANALERSCDQLARAEAERDEWKTLFDCCAEWDYYSGAAYFIADAMLAERSKARAALRSASPSPESEGGS